MIRKPKIKYAQTYNTSDIQDKTKQFYSRKHKQQKIQFEEHIKRKKGKKTYTSTIKFKDDGNIRKTPSKNVIQSISKNEKYTLKKWRLQDGSIKRRYKSMDIYETTTLYERQQRMDWQVCAKMKYKKGNQIKTKFIFSPVRNSKISYNKVKHEAYILMAKAEQYYEPLQMKFFIRYFDYEGGTMSEENE